MFNTTAHSRTLHSGNISRNEWPHGYKIDKKKAWLLAIGKMAKHESKGSYGQICQNLTRFIPNVT